MAGEISRDKYYEALGLEVPSEPGAEAGGNEPSVAVKESSGANAEEIEVGAAEPAENDAEGKSNKDVQSDEENSRFAKMRRGYEKKYDELVASLNLKLSNGREVKSESDYKLYLSEQNAAEVGEKADGEGADGADAEADAESESAKDEPGDKGNDTATLLELGKAQLESINAERAELEKDKLYSEYLKSVAEVSKYNPSIKTPEDLAADPKYTDICALIEKGFTVPQAYLAVHGDELFSKRNASGHGKEGTEHLSSDVSRGDGGITVPPDIARYYKLLNPKMTEAEMKRDYAKFLGK